MEDHVKDDKGPKMVCAAAEPASDEASAAVVAASSPETDYSSFECWEKRYREGMFVEWYCGFDHIRPLFERFIPKVCRNRRTHKEYTRKWQLQFCFAWLMRLQGSQFLNFCSGAQVPSTTALSLCMCEPLRRIILPVLLYDTSVMQRRVSSGERCKGGLGSSIRGGAGRYGVGSSAHPCLMHQHRGCFRGPLKRENIYSKERIV